MLLQRWVGVNRIVVCWKTLVMVQLIPIILGFGEMILKEKQKFKANLGYKVKLNRKRQFFFFFLRKRVQCWVGRKVGRAVRSGRSRGRG